MTKPIRLHANENLLGPSPMAIDAIQQTALEANLYSTPQEHDKLLLDKLMAIVGHGLTADQFVLGNGSGEVLRMIAQAYIKPGSHVVLPRPTFIAYKRQVLMHGGEVIPVPLVDHQIDLDGVLKAITPETVLTFICNPNNPTGLIITHDEMADFLSRVPAHVTVVVDEAYLHFCERDDFPRMGELVSAGHNVIVTRTFSKVFGLAGLRVGYGFGQPERIAPVKERYIVFDTGRMAFKGAAAALADEAHIVNTLETVRAAKAYFYSEFDKLGLSYLESEAFYILLRDLPMDAQTMVDEVAKHGVLIRHTDVFEMPNYVRVSIGRPEDNQAAVAAIKKVLADNL